MATVIAAEKRTLRRLISAKLRALPVTDIAQQSEAIASRVLALPAFKESRRVSCYMSMPTSEVVTTSLIAEILDQEKTLFIPKIDLQTASRMDFLRIHGRNDLASLKAGTWGIKEPELHWLGSPRQSALEAPGIDIVLVPGVAFDRSMSRLGHGKGYYDRFISSYVETGQKRPLLVALALREQICDNAPVPTTEHDWKMDIIVTPDETIRS
ncbi:5-formyltetrahydrofolate cyclo-ligase [Schizophyllum amplum]|uniref:5-formyltetrahydrofolate cyclo-ligase n=1 Tax=Schizophyllum amplum TaxID=97359 RepID=A0A550CBT3_9AGAR|nr:5-formyltetrahydrofolate cyclo-ligase [Auriculariopsis ampla]